MAILVHQYRDHITFGDSAPYAVQVWGAQRADGRWEGWLVFVAHDGRAVLATARETVQSSLDGLCYWATGLEPVYREGAFGRARIVSPPAHHAA